MEECKETVQLWLEESGWYRKSAKQGSDDFRFVVEKIPGRPLEVFSPKNQQEVIVISRTNFPQEVVPKVTPDIRNQVMVESARLGVQFGPDDTGFVVADVIYLEELHRPILLHALQKVLGATISFNTIMIMMIEKNKSQSQ
jgi:hypothetical protein